MKDTLIEPTSRLQGFYAISAAERISLSKKAADINSNDLAGFGNFGTLGEDLVDTFIENGVGTFSLPLGIATNFTINGQDILIPMAIEESSVVAAASFGAKLIRAGGGFQTSSTAPIMTGQVQIFIDPKTDYDTILLKNKAKILAQANHSFDRLLSRGGGAQDLSWFALPELGCVVIHLHIHTADAMGANIVNTMCETVAPLLCQILPGQTGLRILTNLCTERRATARCTIPLKAFGQQTTQGQNTVDRILMADAFAQADISRATTHNKGIMNGIDAVVIATGNDWRAVEAGAHAYCCRDGRYRPMTQWSKDHEGNLVGKLELPMALGTVGGVTKLHPTAQSALKLMGSPNSCRLAEIVCCVGLAQNLSALRALGTEGIQQGHMALHRKNLEMLHKLQ
ncbi:MAG: hydroxymethylglutaryl-CoA reductase, degradative [Zetaproteobacteria bacterium]|nr:hydroxymethylglutaryl-CoA reductase, degradative [Zetaproteobacteria bacterium]